MPGWLPCTAGGHLRSPRQYSFNFPRQEGLITLDNSVIYLPLKKGDSEIRIAVAEVFGGWGLMARFEDSAGLVIEP